MSKIHSIRDAYKGWEIVMELTLSIESKERPMQKIPKLKDTCNYLDGAFNKVILSKFNDVELTELYERLLDVRNYINNHTHKLAENVRQASEDSIEIILSKLNSIKEYFSKIENIDFFVSFHSKGMEIINSSKEKYDAKITELLGDVTEKYIYSHHKIMADKIETNLVVKSFFLYGLLLVMFLVSIMLFCTIGSSNEYSLNNTISKIMIILPMVWAVTLLSKRVYEDKKLAQTYRHKEIVSRSYLNYLELFKYQYGDDEVRKTLSKVAVDALGLNPALLLEKSTAEKIPMEELLLKIIDNAKLNKSSTKTDKE